LSRVWGRSIQKSTCRALGESVNVGRTGEPGVAPTLMGIASSASPPRNDIGDRPTLSSNVSVRESLRLQRAEADSSRSHAGDSGSSPWRHVRSRTFAYAPHAMTARRPQADPNAPQTPRHTNREGTASSFGEEASSCSAAYSPGCPTQSWSKRSSGDQAGPTRPGIRAPA
jgi:hypothetical protein